MKRRSKKLLLFKSARRLLLLQAQGAKVFWFFFSKKNILLSAFLSVTGIAQAHGDAVPYIDIEFLLDNSPSMEIGATPGDIAAMMYLTPCSVPGAVYGRFPSHFTQFGGMSASGQIYNAYRCTEGTSYDGQAPPFREPACPIAAARGVTESPVMRPAMFIGPRCTNLPAQAHDAPPTAGAPCAFACHFDARDPPGPTHDYYGLARSTVGQLPCYEHGASPGACAITLRFDLVKNAVNRAIAAMQEDSFAGLNNLRIGVFTFDTDLHAIYPAPGSCGARGSLACQAGDDWAVALGSVGTAPNQPDMPDAGIQPFAGRNGGATDLPTALRTLIHADLGNAGDAMTAQSPAKALILVTDGLDDHFEGGRRTLGAIDPALCQGYKEKGYRVFVLYTPYYPLMNGFYLALVSKVAEGKGPGSLAYNLRQCATDPQRDFIAASPADAASISDGLYSLLMRALSLRD